MPATGSHQCAHTDGAAINGAPVESANGVVSIQSCRKLSMTTSRQHTPWTQWVRAEGQLLDSGLMALADLQQTDKTRLLQTFSAVQQCAATLWASGNWHSICLASFASPMAWHIHFSIRHVGRSAPQDVLQLPAQVCTTQRVCHTQ